MPKFYVNRGGGRAPEGPFEEAQIVKLILAGKLRGGHVSEVGKQRFYPLENHPPFAAALSDAGVAAAPVPAASRAAPKGKSSSRGILLGAVVALFGLALAAVAIGSYVMFSNGGMPIQGALPTDTEGVFEVRSVSKLLADLHAVRVADTSRYLSAAFFDDAEQALTDCFGPPKAQSRALILAATSLGIAGRKLGTGAEGGVLVSFANATPVNVFLSSPRFKYVGLLAKSGRRYTLTSAPQPPSANVDHARRALLALSTTPASVEIFWFETAKVLFVGSPTFAASVAHVLALDVPSLEQAPSFKAAQRDLVGTPNIIGYLDSSNVEAGNDPAVQALLASSKSWGLTSSSLEIIPEGLLTHAVSRAPRATADAGAPEPTAPAIPITLVDRLPAETFAYVAGATSVSTPGAGLEARLLARLGAANAPLAAQVGAFLAQSEQRLHVKPADLLSSLGDQGAVALVASPNYSVAVGDPRQMAADFALVYVQALRDEAPPSALVKALQTELGAVPGPYTVEQDTNGCAVTATGGALRARARVANGQLFFAMGGTPLVERSLGAFENGENTLASDAAHRAARAKLPGKGSLVAWLDLGRVLDATQKTPILAVPSWRLGFDALHALHWTGAERVTTALSLTEEREAGSDVYRIDALNLPVAFGAYAIAAP